MQVYKPTIKLEKHAGNGPRMRLSKCNFQVHDVLDYLTT